MSVRYPDHVPGHGMHVVGVDIAPGIYRCAPGRDGFWLRYTGTGETVRYRADDPDAARVQVDPSDLALESHVRGDWRSVRAGRPGPSRAAETAPRTRMVIYPALPPRTARLLRDNPHLVTVARKKAAGGAVRRPHAEKGQWWLPSLVILPATIIVSSVLLGQEGVAAGVAAGLVVSVLFAVARPLWPALAGDAARSRRDVIAGSADRVVLAEDLDGEARELLARTQLAIAAVIDSRVQADGLIDAAKNAIVLPEQEWEIARSLAEITRLTAEVESVLRVAGSSEVADRARARRSELAARRRSVAERVTALEAYAGRVREADRARSAEEHLRMLAAGEEEHGELLAGTVRDELATKEINALAAEAEELRRRLDDGTPPTALT